VLFYLLFENGIQNEKFAEESFVLDSINLSVVQCISKFKEMILPSFLSPNVRSYTKFAYLKFSY